MKKELSVSAIKEGTVIDHIPSNVTFKVVDILDLKGIRGIISVATNLTSKLMRKKGIIKISGKDLTKEEVQQAIFPLLLSNEGMYNQILANLDFICKECFDKGTVSANCACYGYNRQKCPICGGTGVATEKCPTCKRK